MKRRKRQLIDVELRLSLPTLQVIDALAKQGILGETREEVVIYIMRSYLFDKSLLTRPKP